MSEGYEELRIVKYLSGRAVHLGVPLMGTFELTARCNLNCKMCYVHLSKDEVDKRGRELTADQWLGIAEAARAKGMLLMLLTGGEPLLRPDFEYIYTSLRKMGILVSINTNGTMVNDDVLRLFRAQPPARVNMSLYGATPEAYGRLCGDEAAFEKALSALRSMKALGLNVKINHSMTPHNYRDAKAVYDIAAAEGAHIQMASYMFPAARCGEEHIGCGDRLSPKDSARLGVLYDRLRFSDERFMLRAENMKKGIRQEEDDGCGGSPEMPHKEGERIFCRAGRSTFWMTWDGRMTPCGMINEPCVYPLEVGFDAAWDELRAKTLEIFLPPECTSCPVRHACDVCAASCYTETGSFDGVPRYLCERTKEILRLTELEYQRIKEQN